jgi:glycosyltransferase involved in cell wall biosynthesis
MSKKLTIVTVVFNAAKDLECTIQNIISQTYFSEIEYIIIDGNSTDGTIDIIRKYEQYLSKWISEKDKGVYDAMNKGIMLASGTWINFMNAGDIFVDNEIVEKVFNQNVDFSDVVYGNYIIAYQTLKKAIYVPNDLTNAFYLWMPLNHQSTFIKTEIARAHPYSLDYKIASDYEQVLAFFSSEKRFQHIDMFIAEFADGGLSSNNKVAYHQEIYDIARKYGIYVSKKDLQKVIFKAKSIDMIKQIFPRTVFERLMQIKNFFVK